MPKGGGLRMPIDHAKNLVAGMSREEAVRRFGREFVDVAMGVEPTPAPTQTKRGPFNAHPRARRWPTPEGETVVFPSKTEAGVFDRLKDEVARTPGAVLFRQVPLVLDTIAPNARGVPYKLTVDFMVKFKDGTRKYVEGKTKKRNREWARGVAAARAAGFAIEEVSS